MTETKNIFQKLSERNRMKEDIESLGFISSGILYKFYNEELNGNIDKNVFNKIYNIYVNTKNIVPELNIEDIYIKALIHYKLNFLYDKLGNFIKIV